jgi:hypothetical protein
MSEMLLMLFFGKREERNKEGVQKNEWPDHIHIHIAIDTSTYIYIYICVCVYVIIWGGAKGERRNKWI